MKPREAIRRIEYWITQGVLPEDQPNPWIEIQKKRQKAANRRRNLRRRISK